MRVLSPLNIFFRRREAATGARNFVTRVNHIIAIIGVHSSLIAVASAK